MKKILISLLFLACIGAGFGLYWYNKPVESLEHKKAEVVISADQLIKEYETNEKAADGNFLGKVIEVTGKVTGITEEEGKKKVSIGTSNPMSAVICEMDDKMSIAGLAEGDNVKMKGMCSGYLGDVILVQSWKVK